MKNNDAWVLIDTETNGISNPIFVVDLAAQKMCGWRPIGKPYQVLLNQNIDISPEASRINGYTREILERDGVSARSAYEGFQAYAENLPIASYNLNFDWDRVLVPEWKRLGIQQIGHRGFCVLKLAQRLLDPVPAGNCKLQTLRQFYRLPERGAHSALGDVLTVVDLIEKVLQPIAEKRKISSISDICAYTEMNWYPTRLSFGKYKGRSFKDASHDRELRGWLEWLASSENASTASMGSWYLSNMDNKDDYSEEIAASAVDTNSSNEPRSGARSGVIIFHSIELEEIRFLVTAARERLADLEVIYARECNAVAVTQSRLFSLLKDVYRKRDNLRLLVSYRKKYLEAISSGLDDPDDIKGYYSDERRKSDQEYDDASKIAESQKVLTEDQQSELKNLFRKLVRLFHPDRHYNNPDAYKNYTILTQEITAARDAGDIEKLREIANDPQAYARKIGAGAIDLTDEEELGKLKKLYESIQIQIVAMLESIDQLRLDPKYELSQLAARRPDYLDDVSEKYREEIIKECDLLEKEAKALAEQIEYLNGAPIVDGLF